MPVLTITAVDHTQDLLTVVGHGLLTGAGPVDVRALNNTAASYPAPLVAVTDYWIIRVDANTFKLATSSANALAGTAINLTTNGSGTLLLEYDIPYRRARTYVPSSVDVAGAQLKSADLNAKMDALKAMHALLTDQAQSIWSAPALNPDTTSFFPRPHKLTNWAFSGDISANPGGLGACLLSSGAGDIDICLSDEIRKGRTLASVSLWVQGDSSVDVVATVYKHDFTGGTVASIGTNTATNPGASTTILTVDVTDTQQSNELVNIWLRVNANAANAKLLRVILTYA